jgi:hypothetical protein
MKMKFFTKNILNSNLFKIETVGLLKKLRSRSKEKQGKLQMVLV